MSENVQQNAQTLSNKILKYFWLACILGLGVVLPIYFTMTESGTAIWLINAQAWIFEKLSGTAKWYPAVTGLFLCVIHIFAIIGIVSAFSWLWGMIKK